MKESITKVLAERDKRVVKTEKQAALMGYGRPLDDGLRIEAEVGQTALESFDIEEGAKAFIEKRKPSFKQDG